MNPGHQQLIQIATVALLPFTGTLLFAAVICRTTLLIREWLMHAGPRSAAELAAKTGQQS